MSTNTNLMGEMVTVAGGDVSALPDNLESTHWKALCEALGVDTSGLTDNLKTSYMKAIIEGYAGGGGGSKPEGTIQITENGTHDVTEYASAEVMVSGGGDDVLNALIDGSIEGEFASDINKVAPYTFYKRNALEAVDFPLVTELGTYSFSNCKNLKTANIPLVTKINSFAFNYCEVLETVDFPLVTELGQDAFSYCHKIKTANFPLVTRINMSTFFYCYDLESVNLPKATQVENSAFTRCEKLKNINLPLVKELYTAAFSKCYSLEKMVLGSETVCNLKYLNVFESTPFTGYNGLRGTFYVPQALIEEYKTATNWSALYAQGFCEFLPIEGSEYE